jgi:hypothetical protein
MVEVFTKQGTNSQAKRELIFQKTGMIPAIYDKGTHYVANHRLTSEMLEQVCKDEDVLEVTGEYTGGIGGWGASHEYREHRHRHKEDEYSAVARPSPASSYSHQNQQQEQLVKQQRRIEKRVVKEEKRRYGKNIINRSNYKPIVYTAIGILGVIALAGFIISGGLLPRYCIIITFIKHTVSPRCNIWPCIRTSRTTSYRSNNSSCRTTNRSYCKFYYISRW